MENTLLRITMILCLGIGSYAMTSETITMPAEAGYHLTNALTTLDIVYEDYTKPIIEETVLKNDIESDVTSTTAKNDVTTDDVIKKIINVTMELQMNITNTFRTTVDKIPTTTPFNTEMTSPTQHSTEFYSTLGPSENVLNTEGVFHSTQAEGVLHSTNSQASVPLRSIVTERARNNWMFLTEQVKETAEDETTTKPSLQAGQKLIESEADPKHPQENNSGADHKHPQEDKPIDRNQDWAWYERQAVLDDVRKPNTEIPSNTKEFDENNVYYNSPQYLQRRTINHAAVWITVGFVAILLTYILALFIHEKGRSEWRLATHDYSRFENEVSQDDDTSITIDLDEPSTPLTVTSAVIETTSTQNMMIKQPVYTTKSR